ncbi:hypothetical protein DCS_02194 [Drechmeria coniospora]|uniref:Cell wall galactomannoprotein n=1 Tax=Drechmeria coniospora TaxID=98403 RepID=A0A151GVD1_DRECN|nr:hypothetical protein DCS_02194 [Drechmeria coniospora]KYK61054.1 hypothetical protein DCS_02194 [Drechmeria coniospora]ODA80821.1 hypothetical protein RJ55_03781 [Drechmeria coniospora]
MQFKFLAVASIALSTAGPVAALPAGVTVNANAIVKTAVDLSSLTTKTVDLLKTANTGNILSVLPKVTANIKSITKTAQDSVKAIQSSADPKFAANVQYDICKTYNSLIKVEKSLAQSLIDQKSLVTPILALPLNLALAPIKGALSDLTKTVGGLVPVCNVDLKTNQKTLDDLLAKVNSLYNILKLIGF